MTWEAGAARLAITYDAEIEELRAELVRVEDFTRDPEVAYRKSQRIRRQIRALRFERDLIPEQRTP